MIKIRLFAMLRELSGVESLEMPLPEGKRVKSVIEEIARKYPILEEPFRKRQILVVINQRYASTDSELSDGDEIALLPPVSGG